MGKTDCTDWNKILNWIQTQSTVNTTPVGISSTSAPSTASDIAVIHTGIKDMEDSKKN